LEFTGKEADSL